MASAPLDGVVSAISASAWEARRAPVVVAVSGGIDSMCLLHLLRFRSAVGKERIHVAHFDHRMRPDSGGDARWLAGVCRAWELRLHREEAAATLSTEAQARDARYAFLARVKARESCGAVLTGHTADDQAETVLFRAARGAGPDGLAGVQPTREDGVERPLIRTWRREIETYARAVRLPVRQDPTNLDKAWTRNRIRREILPALEEAVPGARSSLARLAQLSLGQREALEGLSALALGQCRFRGSRAEGFFVLDLDVLRAWSDPVVGQVLRQAGRRLGLILGSGAVQRTLELIREGRDGSSVDLVRGHVATRSLGALRIGLGSSAAVEGARSVVIPSGEEPGQAEWRAGSGVRRVRWGPCRAVAPGGSMVWSKGALASTPVTPGTFSEGPRLKDGDAAAVWSGAELRFPLQLRTRRPGDRMMVAGKERRLKTIMAESGVPSFDRDTTPVLADSGGAVLWIPGLTPSGPIPDPAAAEPGREERTPDAGLFCVTLSRLEGEAES